MPPGVPKAVMARRLPRHSAPSPQDHDATAAPLPTAIEWAPPALSSSSCCQGAGESRRLEKAKSLEAPHCSPRTRDARSPKAQSSSKAESALSRHPGGLGAQKEHRKSHALLFPLWQTEQGEQGTDLEAQDGDEERSLAARLFQAEQCLAEKDQRIEALEACTARLAERLNLAEGLAAALPKEQNREPSTPGSTRSTVGSTAWTNSEMMQLCPLRRNRTVESLCSAASVSAPDSPKMRAAINNKQLSIWGANGPYASAADVDSVCRRSEQLLKAMTSTIAQGERRSPRSSAASSASSAVRRPSSPRPAELCSSSRFVSVPKDSTTRTRAKPPCS